VQRPEAVFKKMQECMEILETAAGSHFTNTHIICTELVALESLTRELHTYITEDIQL